MRGKTLAIPSTTRISAFRSQCTVRNVLMSIVAICDQRAEKKWFRLENTQIFARNFVSCPVQ